MNKAVDNSARNQQPDPAGLGVAFECAVMACRLADLLRRRFAADPSPVMAAIGFLEYQYSELAGSRSLADNQSLLAQRRRLGGDQPLDRLRQVFGLTGLETDLLVLAGLAEHHEGYADIFRTLHPSAQPYPTMGLAAQLLCPGEAQRQPLRAEVELGTAFGHHLVVLQGDGPFYFRHLVLAEALWPVVLGIDAWPGAVRPESLSPISAGLQIWLARDDVRRAVNALGSGAPATILVSASTGSVAWHRGLALAEAAGAGTVALRWPKAPGEGFDNLLQVHAAARHAVPVVCLPAPENGAAAMPCPLAAYPGPVLLCAGLGTVLPPERRPLLNIPVEPLQAPELRAMWRQTLPALAGHADYLAARYPMEPAAAAEVALDLTVGRLPGGVPPRVEEVADALRTRAATSLGGGVQLIRPTAGWEQLVLPDAQIGQLNDAVRRLDLQAKVLDDWGFLKGRRGARGVRLLFSGPPGTGKTLSAEVLARELNVDLLLVDLSRVVSKWIGETEKNLAEVFETAERAKAVLFFDEADALFGKRTEVSDSHDRYANLETAYLLSRLERYDGLAILATNLRQNIDAAFTRRLDFIIEYEEPAYEQRLALWRCHLPAGVPLAGDVNPEALAARFPVVGGLIRNAAVAAAFLAAGEGGAITKDHFVRAIRREYEKAGKAYRELPGRDPGR